MGEILENVFWFAFWITFCDQLFLDGKFTDAIISRIRRK